MKTATTTSIGASLQALAERAPEPVHAVTRRRAAAPRTVETLPSNRLTARQMEVLGLLCEGLPNKLICRQLNIATGTVKVHIGCILRELGVTSRLQAVVAARRLGLDRPFDAGVAEKATDVMAGEAAGFRSRQAPARGYRNAVAF